jgi:hypothetical protein
MIDADAHPQSQFPQPDSKPPLPVPESGALTDAWSMPAVEDWQPEYCAWARDSNKE